MADLYDYLQWRGDLTFSQAPVNPVDTLIFSALSYISFGGSVEALPEVPISLKDAAEEFFRFPDQLERCRVKNDISLLQAAVETPRFRNIMLLQYRSHLVPEEETQFAAITFLLDDNSGVITFRGTDYSLVGWKEDFNMTFCSAVPAQLEAVAYLQKVAECTEGPLYVGGHSKGGNLAIYAAAHVSPEIQNRIVTVFNNDGPGFQQDVVEGAGYQAICDRIKTFIPQTSLFGLMLEHAEPYTVIESSGIFVMQHDPYTWTVKGPDFVYLEEVTASGRFMDATLRNWLAEITPVQREQFVDAVYEAISADEAVKVQDLAWAWLTNTGGMLKALRDVDDETAAMIREVLKQLLHNMGRTVQMMIREEQEERFSPLKEKLEHTLELKREHTAVKPEWRELPEFEEQNKNEQHHIIGHR